MGEWKKKIFFSNQISLSLQTDLLRDVWQQWWQRGAVILTLPSIWTNRADACEPQTCEWMRDYVQEVLEKTKDRTSTTETTK